MLPQDPAHRAGSNLACVVSRNSQHPVVPWSPKQTPTHIGKKSESYITICKFEAISQFHIYFTNKLHLCILHYSLQCNFAAI